MYTRSLYDTSVEALKENHAHYRFQALMVRVPFAVCSMSSSIHAERVACTLYKALLASLCCQDAVHSGIGIDMGKSFGAGSEECEKQASLLDTIDQRRNLRLMS